MKGFPLTRPQYTIFINGHLAILKSFKCLQLKKELNNLKDRIKMSRYVSF